jgi:DNA-binding FadR family transcriptional regulator
VLGAIIRPFADHFKPEISAKNLNWQRCSSSYNWFIIGPDRTNPLPKVVATAIEGSLRKRIAAGEWSATGRLPAERELATQYGVARNTVRRAVEAIAHDGTVERHVGRGTFVNGEVRELADIVRRVTGVSPTDLMAARLIVEPQAAAIAANNASSSDLLAIAEAHDRASEARQTEEFEYWDTQLHQRIFAATRNELLVSIHAILQVIRSRNAWIELKRKTFSENRWRDYCAQHAKVIAALKNRDAERAREAMRVHIAAIELSLFGS